MNPATTGRPGPAQTTTADRVTYGAVHLDVTDLDASLRFWAGAVGLTVLERGGDGSARLGVEDHELVVLHPGATSPVRRGHTGLYHLAIHLPSEAEFARSLARLSAAGVRQAPTDHVMHWATYAWDPDGIGLELSFETLDRFDAWVTDHGDLGVRHTDGRVTSGRDPLDLDEVFSYLPDRDVARPMPAGTRIGHVHLHVADLDAAVTFYAGHGFELHHLMDGFGMAELSAGGSFPHRLALNTWQGAGAPPPPEGTAGLRHVELRGAGAPATLRDPAGNALVLA